MSVAEKPKTDSNGLIAQPKNSQELRHNLLKMLPMAKRQYPDLPIDSTDIVMLVRSVERTPAILKCTMPSIMGSLVEAKSRGWSVDGVLSQAYLVPFGNAAVLMPGYRGMMDMVRRSGVCEPTMDTIHDCDIWAWSGDTFERPTIKLSDTPERRSRPIVGAFAQGRFYKDGFTKTFYWPYGQIIAHRNKYSQAWQRSPKPDNPWHQENPGHWVMCAKTVMLDAIKRGLPTSAQDKRLLTRIEDETGVIDAADFRIVTTDEAEQVVNAIAQEAAVNPTVPGDAGAVDRVAMAARKFARCGTLEELDSVATAFAETYRDLTLDEDAGVDSARREAVARITGK